MKLTAKEKAEYREKRKKVYARSQCHQCVHYNYSLIRAKIWKKCKLTVRRCFACEYGQVSYFVWNGASK